MTFEEVKELFKKSIDTTNTMNEAIENLIQSIYLKGYNDALKHSKVGRWIPISERLPEKNMVCFVAVGKFNLTQIAMYSDLMGTIDRRIFYRGDYAHENFENITPYVKAWMPLPEPYKASPTGAESEVQDADRDRDSK